MFLATEVLHSMAYWMNSGSSRVTLRNMLTLAGVALLEYPAFTLLDCAKTRAAELTAAYRREVASPRSAADLELPPNGVPGDEHQSGAVLKALTEQWRPPEADILARVNGGHPRTGVTR
jgi:hypothetical protein